MSAFAIRQRHSPIGVGSILPMIRMQRAAGLDNLRISLGRDTSQVRRYCCAHSGVFHYHWHYHYPLALALALAQSLSLSLYR